MSRNKKVDLRQFTKDELIYYITQCGIELSCYRTATEIILEKRIDDNFKKTHKLLEANKKLHGMENYLQYKKNHETIDKLYAENDKYSKILYDN